MAEVSVSSLCSLAQQRDCFSIGEMDTSSGPGDWNILPPLGECFVCESLIYTVVKVFLL